MGGDNLPDLSNPNLEIGSLCVTVPTAEASEQTSTEVRSIGVDARPPFTVSTHGHDESVQTTNYVRSVGTDARPMPCPWLSPPDVPTRSLASRRVVSARPETPSDVIADELCSSMVEASLLQRRAVQLAVDFGLECNAQMLQRILNRMSSHFEHLTHVEPTSMVAYLSDQLTEWMRRPSLPQQTDAVDLVRR